MVPTGDQDSYEGMKVSYFVCNLLLAEDFLVVSYEKLLSISFINRLIYS